METVLPAPLTVTPFLPVPARLTVPALPEPWLTARTWPPLITATWAAETSMAPPLPAPKVLVLIALSAPSTVITLLSPPLRLTVPALPVPTKNSPAIKIQHTTSAADLAPPATVSECCFHSRRYLAFPSHPVEESMAESCPDTDTDPDVTRISPPSP